MTLEKITLKVPGQAPQVADVAANPSDSDEDIARRLSRTFPAGTLLGISGAKWTVVGPGQVTLADEPPPSSVRLSVRPSHVVEEPPTSSSVPEPVVAPPEPVVTLKEASESLARDPSGEEYAALLIERGLGIRAPLTEATAPPLPDLFRSEAGPRVGETWKPKDPRRKATFTIRAVTASEVIGEDGRTVSLERLKRYVRVA